MESILRIHHFTHLQPKQFMEIFRQLIFLDFYINNQQGGNAWQSTLHYWLQNDKGKCYQYLEPTGTLGTKTRRARRTSFKRLGHRNAGGTKGIELSMLSFSLEWCFRHPSSHIKGDWSPIMYPKIHPFCNFRLNP